jgi:two-component system LytT family response regulator
MTRRVLIVDDEAPSRMNLRHAMSEHARWSVVGDCASAAEARATLAREQVDLLFLDIQMPRESGIELARELAAQSEPPLVVFATAYDAYAIAAFEVHALDYLLKPLDDARLAATLQRADALLEQRQRASYGAALRACLNEDADRYWRELRVRSIGRIECVPVGELLWLESAGNYVELHLAGRTVLHRAPIREFDTHLDPEVFVRVHRCAMVRRDQLAKLEVAGDGVYRCLLRCGAAVPVSATYVQAVRAALGAD